MFSEAVKKLFTSVITANTAVDLASSFMISHRKCLSFIYKSYCSLMYVTTLSPRNYVYVLLICKSIYIFWRNRNAAIIALLVSIGGSVNYIFGKSQNVNILYQNMTHCNTISAATTALVHFLMATLRYLQKIMILV